MIGYNGIISKLRFKITRDYEEILKLYVRSVGCDRVAFELRAWVTFIQRQ